MTSEFIKTTRVKTPSIKAKQPDTTYQQSLDKWFTSKDPEGNILEATYKIFYLEWTSNVQRAEWLSTMPPDDKITYRTTIKWSTSDAGGSEDIHLIGYIPEPIYWNHSNLSTWDKTPTEGTKSTVTVAEPESYYTNVAFLKSHLQKAIRRSQTGLALKTANHFFRLDLTQFLRRLAIIMLEDVHLMDSFSILVWLMAAHSKGYNLDRSQIYWLFGLVYNLAEAEWWDQCDFSDYKPPKKGYWKTGLSKLTADQKTLIYSLQFRKAFGGLTGDKKLIDVLTQNWMNRFKNPTVKENGEWLQRLCGTSVEFLSPPEEQLELSEWILPAIDFHVLPNILSILMDKYEEFKHDDLKETIWHCSSGYNNKKRTEYRKPEKYKEYQEIWKTIRPQFYGLAQYFLTNNY